MSILSMCQWLQDTDIGTSIRESIWVFPIIESTHVLALSISVGLLLVSDLRLMGYIMKRRPVSEVYEQIKPWMFTGFAIMTITGIFLFWCQAVKAYNSIFFKTKVILLIVAAINFAVGTFALHLQSILGLMRAKFFLLELFSGLLLPISFFPHIVQKILSVMPFEYISYVPMLIYLGKLNGIGLARAIVIQILWVTILLAIGDGLWRWSSRKVTIQGG